MIVQLSLETLQRTYVINIQTNILTSSDSSFSSTFSSFLGSAAAGAAAPPAPPAGAATAMAAPPPDGTEANFSLPRAISSVISLPLTSERKNSILSSSASAPTV